MLIGILYWNHLHLPKPDKVYLYVNIDIMYAWNIALQEFVTYVVLESQPQQISQWDVYYLLDIVSSDFQSSLKAILGEQELRYTSAIGS